MCNGDFAIITCGFSSPAPSRVIINWKITMRSDNESDERIISGLDYLNDNGGGLLWVPNNDSSYLRVGPVNVTYYNQSTYQCIILRNDNNTNSDIATLEVVGKYCMHNCTMHHSYFLLPYRPYICMCRYHFAHFQNNALETRN